MSLLHGGQLWKTQAPTLDLGVLVPHLEDLRLCSYSLGRERDTLHWDAALSLLLKPTVTSSWATRPLTH